MTLGVNKPKEPSKYNPTWGAMKDLEKYIHDTWRRYNAELSESPSVQFVKSFNIVKDQAIPYAHEHLILRDKPLVQIEENLNTLYGTYWNGQFIEEALYSIKGLEERRSKLLLDREID